MGPTTMSLVSNVGRYFWNMAWGVAKGTIKYFHALLASDAHGASMTPLVHSLPLATWAWVLTLDPFGAFHLGLHHPHLYLHILFALWQKMQLVFHFPFDCLIQDLFDVAT